MMRALYTAASGMTAQELNLAWMRVQHFAHPLQERLHRERLGQVGFVIRRDLTLRLSGIAAHQQNPGARTQSFEFSRQVTAAHSRHDDIGEKQINGLGQLAVSV
jgi:hypothetical protein